MGNTETNTELETSPNNPNAFADYTKAKELRHAEKSYTVLKKKDIKNISIYNYCDYQNNWSCYHNLAVTSHSPKTHVKERDHIIHLFSPDIVLLFQIIYPYTWPLYIVHVYNKSFFGIFFAYIDNFVRPKPQQLFDNIYLVD